MNELWAGLGILAVLAFVMFRLVRYGRSSQRARTQGEQLQDIEKANQVRRDAEREPDPANRLQDDWRR